MRTGSSVGQVFCKSQGISSRIRGLEKAAFQFGIQIAPGKPANVARLRTILEHPRDNFPTRRATSVSGFPRNCNSLNRLSPVAQSTRTLLYNRRDESSRARYL